MESLFTILAASFFVVMIFGFVAGFIAGAVTIVADRKTPPPRKIFTGRKPVH